MRSLGGQGNDAAVDKEKLYEDVRGIFIGSRPSGLPVVMMNLSSRLDMFL
jgi:hypothetical protein